MKGMILMITDSFDNRSPAKINPTKNENAPAVEAVIFTFRISSKNMQLFTRF